MTVLDRTEIEQDTKSLQIGAESLGIESLPSETNFPGNRSSICLDLNVLQFSLFCCDRTLSSTLYILRIFNKIFVSFQINKSETDAMHVTTNYFHC